MPLFDGGDNHIENLRLAHVKKTSSCVGNYSRKRPTYTGEPPRNNKSINDEPDGITFGDGWIHKKRGGISLTMYLDVTGLSIDDTFVQAFIYN